MKKKHILFRTALIVLLIAALVGGVALFVLYRKMQKGELPADYSVDCVAVCEDIVIGYETTDSHFPIPKTVTHPDVYGYEFISWEDGSTKDSVTRIAAKGGKTVVAYYRRADWQDALPRITIFTKERQPVQTKEYRSGSVSLSGCERPVSSASAQIRCRGNGSFTLAEKKSYRLKFDKKVSLLGAAARKNYTLIANYFDKTLARNEIAYALSDRLSGIDYTTTHEWVELWVNGVYEGVYLLCDQIQTGEGRVEIDESASSVDTGYLIEMNMRIAYDPDSYVRIFHENTFYEMLSPELKQGDPAPFQEFIREYLESCTAAIREGSWQQVGALIDVDSFVDTYIVQELTGNVDVGRYSFYLYKEAGGKLFAGPVWDFDLSGGNVSFDMGDHASCPPDRMLYASVNNVWYAALFTREEFVSLVRERLASEEVRLKEAIALLDPDRADGYFGRYRAAIERNFERWPYEEIKPEQDGYEWKYENQQVASILSIEGQYRYLYDWLMKRYDYLLAQI